MSSFRLEIADVKRRSVYAQILVCLVFSLMATRLWYLQGIKGSYYRDLSENNRTRTIRTASPRGMVFDREGRILVRNRASFDVGLLMEDTPNPLHSVLQLADLAGRDPELVAQQFKDRRQSRPFEPRTVLSDVSRPRLARIRVNSHRLPGVMVSAVPTRMYPNGSLAAQLFGYSREISKEELQTLGSTYRPGDDVGKAGLEKQYEAALRGTAGYVQVEVDARGTRRGELGILDETVGGSLYLTLDLDLQRAAEEALHGWRGAVVAMAPESGEVLALASTPTFDANVFSGHVSSHDWSTLLSDPEKPLRNRAISSIYPPGSTMKLLWALAGLQEEIITEHSKTYCPGYFSLGGRRYHCHKRGGHGMVDLKTAIMVSCNVYFYKLGHELGIERMTEYLRQWGFGQKTGIDVPGEEASILPSKEWKRRATREPWYPGDTIPVSIGQGYLAVTPLQMAVGIASLANGGEVVVPHLVKRIKHPNPELSRRFDKMIARTVSIDAKHMELVRELAGEVVANQRGTGRRAAFDSIRVGGKTGTAQVRAGLGEQDDPRFRDHAWFVSFAPVEDPKIVVVVIVENAGHGGSKAAPVAREVMRVFFQKRGELSEEDWRTPSDLAEPPVYVDADASAQTAQAESSG